MTDNLKFIKDLEARSIVLSRNRSARTIDSLDTLLTENLRLKRELAESREENKRLKERLEQPQVSVQNSQIQTIPKTDAKVAPDNPVQDVTTADDTAIRFSLLELK